MGKKLCDLSPCQKGNTCRIKLLGRFSNKKIQRYNNSPSIPDSKIAATADSPLTFLEGTQKLLLIFGRNTKINVWPITSEELFDSRLQINCSFEVPAHEINDLGLFLPLT